MAKKSIIARENKKVALIEKFSGLRQELKSKLADINIGLEEKLSYSRKLQSLPVKSSKSRFVKRCAQCGRPHAVYSKFQLCRICLRNNLMSGMVPGGRKSSW